MAFFLGKPQAEAKKAELAAAEKAAAGKAAAVEVGIHLSWCSVCSTVGRDLYVYIYIYMYVCMYMYTQNTKYITQ